MTPSERDKLTRNMLKRYQKIRELVALADEDAECPQFPIFNTTGKVKSGPADPTARRAGFLLNVDELRRWIVAIDVAVIELEQYYPENAEILTKHFRLDRKTGYKRQYVRYARDSICDHRHISYPMYYIMLDQAVDLVRFHAADRGLFKNAKI